MKAPWKFFAQLTSRRPSAKAQQSPIGNDTDPKAIESEVDHTSAIPLNSTVSASPPAHGEEVSIDQGPVASDQAKGDDDVAPALTSPIDAEEAQTPARLEAHNSGAEARSLLPKSRNTKSLRKPRNKRGERGKRAKAHVAVQSAAAETDRRRVQPPSSRDLFFRDVAILDEEIKTLRIQLARRLHLQNAQLKKMLERFESS
ncbi:MULTISPECIES: hypothetical protein [Sinorhizobium]|uniref:Uncharacterized protein n=1 Tax=Rhizobium fredii TaxID=380 RepID=A0A2L0HFE9_RHIFR|nr:MULTISPECIES: hypothetical protein [Sinorhizobium]AUX79499.1 hypothetical protein NXT3_PC00328 [Sinorhizobium fredii]PDT51162.1 hypothetical protein CO664_22585 [Sinorhizobium sp. NG07B]